MKDPALYALQKKHDQIDESLLDEINPMVAALKIVQNALQESPIAIEEEIPDYYWSCGWLLEKITEHIEAAVKHAEVSLQENYDARKKNAD